MHAQKNISVNKGAWTLRLWDIGHFILESGGGNTVNLATGKCLLTIRKSQDINYGLNSKKFEKNSQSASRHTCARALICVCVCVYIYIYYVCVCVCVCKQSIYIYIYTLLQGHVFHRKYSFFELAEKYQEGERRSLSIRTHTNPIPFAPIILATSTLKSFAPSSPFVSLKM
jgi:hypothetical protein